MKVSIIIPVYNVESYLSQCLDSCLSQSYANIEILAINDGSTDNSSKILDNRALSEPRLKVIHQNNAGVAAARNVGIQHASGEWIMFVDSDDCLLQNACQLMVSTAQSHNLEVLVGGFTTALSNEILSKDQTPTLITGCALIEAIIQEKVAPSLCGKLFKRSLFMELHQSANVIKIGEDFLVTLNALTYTSNAGIVSNPVYFYRQRIDSVMNAPSISAINSRLLFLLEVDVVLQKLIPKMGQQMVDNLKATIFVREYFSYLRDNGKSEIEPQIKNRIKSSYIDNKYMKQHTPIQRRIIVRWYLRNQTIARLLMRCLRLIRSVACR